MGIETSRRTSLIVLTFALTATSLPYSFAVERDGTQRTSVPMKSTGLTGNEEADSKAIAQLYAAGQHGTLIERVAAYLKRYPTGPYNHQVHNYAGLSQLLLKNYAASIQHFKQSVALAEAANNTNFVQYALFNLAAVQREASRIDSKLLAQSDATLEAITPGLLDRENQIKYYTLKAAVSLNLGKYQESIRANLTTAQLSPVSKQTQIMATLERALAAYNDTASLEVIASDCQGKPLCDFVQFRLAQQLIRNGKAKDGEMAARELLKRYPDSLRTSDTLELIAQIQIRSEVNPRAIGLLLPVGPKNRFKAMGDRAKQAIQLAFRIYNSDEPDSKLQLIIEDSGDTAEQALKALNKLYTKHHVIGVLGPLLSPQVDKVAQRAETLGLPLISLAQKPFERARSFVIQAGMTPSLQVGELVDRARKSGMTRFAILHPDDAYGHQYAEAFERAVINSGGEITGIEKYPAKETDYRVPIDKLLGLYYKDARKDELAEIAKKCSEQWPKNTKRAKACTQLPPIINFDAVFIPDEARIATRIIPFFDLRDAAQNVKFLGTAAWSSPEILQIEKKYASSLLFPDSFFAQSESSSVKRFIERYRNIFSGEPGGIEAIAFDAASVLESILAQGRVSTREDLREKLAQTRDVNGVGGKLSFRDGQLHRNLVLLSVFCQKTCTTQLAPLKSSSN